MNMSLYALTHEAVSIFVAIEEADGELTEDLARRLDAIAESLPTKVDVYCRLIREFERRSEVKRAEAERLRKAAQVDGNAAERLTDRLMEALTAARERKATTDLFGVSVCRNAQPTITWEGPIEKLPDEFRRVKVEL